MINVVEQTLGKVVLSIRAPGLSETDTCSLFQTKALANTSVQPVLSNKVYIVPMMAAAGKTMERAVNK